MNGLNYKLSNKKLSYNSAIRIATILEFAAKFTKKEPSLMRYSVSTLANSLTMNITKAQDKLGYQAQMTTKAAIDEFLEAYEAPKL